MLNFASTVLNFASTVFFFVKTVLNFASTKKSIYDFISQYHPPPKQQQSMGILRNQQQFLRDIMLVSGTNYTMYTEVYIYADILE